MKFAPIAASPTNLFMLFYFSVLVVRASSNFMQIYEPYANEGIPRLIAHRMEALWTPPPFKCALNP